MMRRIEDIGESERAADILPGPGLNGASDALEPPQPLVVAL